MCPVEVEGIPVWNQTYRSSTSLLRQLYQHWLSVNAGTPSPVPLPSKAKVKSRPLDLYPGILTAQDANDLDKVVINDPEVESMRWMNTPSVSLAIL